MAANTKRPRARALRALTQQPEQNGPAATQPRVEGELREENTAKNTNICIKNNEGVWMGLPKMGTVYSKTIRRA